jgi:poly(A) polymerase
LLLDRQPKDYDIATAARPQQVKRTFSRNCRIIGRRFKLAHLHFHNNTKILEVSTFRRTPQADGSEADLLITRDNEFGTAEEDALRRDFTVNGLFLDPTRDEILDYTQGLEDLRARTIRTIGDPVVRFREDPVRMLRAAKFAGRLGFSVEPQTLSAMAEVAPDLVRSAPPRLLEEILRLLRGGHALESFQLLRDVGALKSLVPLVADFLGKAPQPQRVGFWRTLEALDHHIAEGNTPSNPVLLGALFHSAVAARIAKKQARSPSTIAEELLGPLSVNLRLPRRDAGCLKRICGVQHRFEQATAERRYQPRSFVRGPYFAEAFELFELRAAALGLEHELVDEWLQKQQSAEDDHDEDAQTPQQEPGDMSEETEPSSELDGAETDATTRKKRRRRRRRRREEHDEARDELSADADESETSEAPVEDEVRSESDEETTRAPRKRRRRRGPRAEEVDAEAETAVDVDADEESAEGAATSFGSPGDDDGEEATAPRQRRRPRRSKDETLAADPDATSAAAAETEDADPDEDADAPRKRRRRRGRGRRGGERSENDQPTVLDQEASAEKRSEPTEEADREAVEDEQGGRKVKRRRRRRRRKGDREAGESAGDGEPSGKPSADKKPAGDREARGKKKRKKRERPGDDRRRKGRDRPGGRDVDVVPRRFDRRGKVEVLEPAPLDLSAFDVELDPKRVPTFGSIVEGRGKPKKRGPRIPAEDRDAYRPPPPPGSEPDGPPPPPPADDSDSFGDW